MIQNNSFCAIPFVSIMVNTDTSIRYCCMVNGSANKLKKNTDEFYTCRDNFIKDAWNSETMQDIRKAMLKGDKISGCSVCYLQESNGGTSNRLHSIHEWKLRLGDQNFDNKVRQAIDNNGIMLDEPVYLDLRLGNLCNLQCRMCNPWNSSQIAKEHLVLKEKNLEYAKVWKETFGTFPIKVLDDQCWFDDDILWDQVNSLIPSLKKVYMTGGEPTLIKNNFKFMEKCIEGKRKDIVLFFNINCTNVNSKFLELISMFDQVNINASIDGIGKLNEYIRYPSDWNRVRENVEKLAQLKNVNLGVTPTIQVYNIFDIPNIIEWVHTLNIRYKNTIFIDFLVNIHPNHLNVNILPVSIRERCQDMLINYKNKIMMDQCHSPITFSSLNGIIGLLENEQVTDFKEQAHRLKTYTIALDEERNQSMDTVLDRNILEYIYGIQ